MTDETIETQIEAIIRQQMDGASAEDTQLAEQIIAALPAMSAEDKNALLADLKQDIA